MAKATTDGGVLSAGAPTVPDVRRAMAQTATAIVKARNASAKPGIVWGWTWGSRGVQYSVNVIPPAVFITPDAPK